MFSIVNNSVISYLKVCYFSIAKFTSSVIAELHIPLARQVVYEVRVLFYDGVEDVLIGQACGVVSHKVLLRYQSPQLAPALFP